MYKEMDDRLAHLSEDECRVDKDIASKDVKEDLTDSKECEKFVGISAGGKLDDIDEKTDPDKPQPDDPTGM